MASSPQSVLTSLQQNDYVTRMLILACKRLNVTPFFQSLSLLLSDMIMVSYGHVLTRHANFCISSPYIFK